MPQLDIRDLRAGVARRATEFVQWLKPLNSASAADVGERSADLLEELVRAGHMTEDERRASYVEEQSVWEFDHVAICSCPPGAKDKWFLVWPDGRVETVS